MDAAAAAADAIDNQEDAKITVDEIYPKFPIESKVCRPDDNILAVVVVVQAPCPLLLSTDILSKLLLQCSLFLFCCCCCSTQSAAAVAPAILLLVVGMEFMEFLSCLVRRLEIVYILTQVLVFRCKKVGFLSRIELIGRIGVGVAEMKN